MAVLSDPDFFMTIRATYEKVLRDLVEAMVADPIALG